MCVLVPEVIDRRRGYKRYLVPDKWWASYPSVEEQLEFRRYMRKVFDTPYNVDWDKPQYIKLPVK